MPTPAGLWRCPVPACPVRYASGGDRDCGGHVTAGDEDEALARAREELGLDAVPGTKDDDSA